MDGRRGNRDEIRQNSPAERHMPVMLHSPYKADQSSPPEGTNKHSLTRYPGRILRVVLVRNRCHDKSESRQSIREDTYSVRDLCGANGWATSHTLYVPPVAGVNVGLEALQHVH